MDVRLPRLGSHAGDSGRRGWSTLARAGRSRLCWPSRRDRVLFGAQAADVEAAEWGIERMRAGAGRGPGSARSSTSAFASIRMIGPQRAGSIPELRVWGKPDPFEALAWAICEQLIELERGGGDRAPARGACWAAAVPRTGLRDAPSAARLAGAGARARLCSFGLTETRAIALRPGRPGGGGRAGGPVRVRPRAGLEAAA